MIDRKFYKTVVDFFKSGKKKPMRGKWFSDDNKYCCAVGAALLALKPNTRNRQRMFMCHFVKKLGLNEDFIGGVVKGFDGKCLGPWYSKDQLKDVMNGYETGKALAKKLFND